MKKNLGVPEEDHDEGGSAVSKDHSMRAPHAPRERRIRDLPETMAQGRFTIDKKLGEGSFGLVCMGWDTKTKQKVAIKLEQKKTSAAGQLGNEARLMNMLSLPTLPQGFAEVFFFGKEGLYSILVMDLLSMSLEDSVQVCRGTFKSSTAAIVAEQGIRLLAYVHSKSIVHRDIKSENFMWGIERKQHHLYIIDFGMSTRFFVKTHVSMQTGRQMTGTARYASVNAMKGCTQSRRDDLEALGHVLMYALRGSLPWSGLDAPTYDKKLKLICQTKETTPLPELCKGFPKEFETFLEYSRNLGFEERPDYNKLVTSFRSLRMQPGEEVKEYALEWLDQASIDPATLVPLKLDEPCPEQPEDVVPVSGRSTLSGQAGVLPKRDAEQT